MKIAHNRFYGHVDWQPTALVSAAAGFPVLVNHFSGGHGNLVADLVAAGEERSRSCSSGAVCAAAAFDEEQAIVRCIA